jgi:hypothetical protein
VPRSNRNRSRPTSRRRSAGQPTGRRSTIGRSSSTG